MNMTRYYKMIVRGENNNFIHELIKNRQYALISFDNSKTDTSPFFYILDPYFRIMDRKAEKDEQGIEKYIVLSQARGYQNYHTGDYHRNINEIKKIKGVSVYTPSEEGLVSILSDKMLIYSKPNAYVNVEHFTFKGFKEAIQVYGRDYRLLADEYFDMRVYLQRVGDGWEKDKNGIVPLDIETLDVNRILLNLFRGECEQHFTDLSDFQLEFKYESQDMNAQYYLTRFHSNLNWRINPVCVLCFRISAFLLPGVTPLISVKKISEDIITQNTITGERYRIDSIYVNSDICTGIEDVREWFTMGVMRSIWEA